MLLTDFSFPPKYMVVVFSFSGETIEAKLLQFFQTQQARIVTAPSRAG